MLSFDDKTLTTDLDRAGYRKMGVSVKVVQSFDEGARSLRTEETDVVVVNMDFSRIDALQVIKAIKSNNEWNEIPVVAASVRSNVRLQKAALDAGADLYVEQPLPRQYFIEKVKGLLDQKVRTNKRIELESKASVTIGSKSQKWGVADLSATGVLLATDQEIEPGTKINVSFAIPGGKSAIEADGEVVRFVKPNKQHPERASGLGIRFIKFKGDSKSRLERFVAKTADEDQGLLYYL